MVITRIPRSSHNMGFLALIFCACMIGGAKSSASTCSGLTSSFVLTDSTKVSPDTKLLRFALPEEKGTLAAPDLAPSGVTAHATIAGEDLDKSYSPISLPNAEGYFELLVKEVSMPMHLTVPVKFRLHHSCIRANAFTSTRVCRSIHHGQEEEWVLICATSKKVKR